MTGTESLPTRRVYRSRGSAVIQAATGVVVILAPNGVRQEPSPFPQWRLRRAARWFGAFVVLGLVGALSGCGDSRVDKDRLATLKREPLVITAAPGTGRAIQQSAVGTAHGIGFGGKSKTFVSVSRTLNGSADAVARFYAERESRRPARQANKCRVGNRRQQSFRAEAPSDGE